MSNTKYNTDRKGVRCFRTDALQMPCESNARGKKETADENQDQKQRVAGTGQVLGTASLFRVRVREQPPSITGGS